MKMPEGYIENQRLVNAVHKSGQPEYPSDIYPILDAIEEMHENGLESPSSILVVGCRLGYEVEQLGKTYPESYVLGVDIVPEFVLETQKRGKALGADMHELPFAKELFDWVFCIGTLEHAYDAPRAAKELLRVARHAVYVTADLEEPNEDNLSHYQHIPDPEVWKKMFKDPNWELLWQEETPNAINMIWSRV